jgi:hypothetical protein
MYQDPVHSIASATEASEPAMEALPSAFGFVPNIAGVLAASPVLINGLICD